MSAAGFRRDGLERAARRHGRGSAARAFQVEHVDQGLLDRFGGGEQPVIHEDQRPLVAQGLDNLAALTFIDDDPRVLRVD